MPKIHIGVIGLAMVVAERNLIVFPEGGHPDITQHGDHGMEEAHRCVLAVPTAQLVPEHTDMPVMFSFGPNPDALGVGLRDTDYSVFNLKAEESEVGFPRKPEKISITPVKPITPKRDLRDMVSLLPVVKRPFRGDALSGDSNVVIARLDAMYADITTENTDREDLEFNSVVSSTAMVFELTYEVTSATPVIHLNNNVIALANPIDDKWVLFIANVPVDELFELATLPTPILHHFDLIYNLFEMKVGDQRPCPKRTKPPGLGDPGYCGPPAKP